MFWKGEVYKLVEYPKFVIFPWWNSTPEKNTSQMKSGGNVEYFGIGNI